MTGRPVDHLVYAVADLDAAIDDFERGLGVRPGAGGQHPGRGTHNALAALGAGCYLELIAPDPAQPDPELGRPFRVDTTGAPRLAGWALRCTDLDAAVSKARSLGFDPGDPFEMHRTTVAGDELLWRLTPPSTGAFPFLIDWGDTAHPSVSAPNGLRLVTFRIEDPDPSPIAAALAALGADVEVVAAEQPSLVAVIDGPGGRTELR
ncbi:MAG: VOC family protein [Acidimicrobiales bacterium]